MGFRAELEQGWEGGETALACLHTAGSCREHGCSLALPDWQVLRNVSIGAQVGPGLPVAASSPSELCPACLCPEKLVQLPVSMSHPSCTAGSTMVWTTGKGLWGECSGCLLSFPMNTSSWECGIPGFGGPLALLCSFPCYQNGRWRLCSCREGGRKVQLLWGRSKPHLPNPGAQSRAEQSSGAGACTGPENNLQSVCSCSAPLGFAHPRQCGEMPQSCSLLELFLLCLAGMAPVLGTCTTPGQQERDSLELVLWVWPVEGLGRACSILGGHRAEPTKHSLRPLCRALLSWKSSVQSSPALQLWLQGQNVTSPAAAAVGGAWAPRALGHDLTSGLGR